MTKKEVICAEDLWDKPLIVSHQTSRNSELFRWLQKSAAELDIVMKYGLIYNVSQKVSGIFQSRQPLSETHSDGHFRTGGVDFSIYHRSLLCRILAPSAVALAT